MPTLAADVATVGTYYSSFHGYHSAEVVPFEKCVDVAEAGIEQKLAVFHEFVRDQDIFKGFTFLSYFHIIVMIPAFEIIVVVNKKTIEQRIFTQHLFNQDE